MVSKGASAGQSAVRRGWRIDLGPGQELGTGLRALLITWHLAKVCSTYERPGSALPLLTITAAT
jgi:hypothetical protein